MHEKTRKVVTVVAALAAAAGVTAGIAGAARSGTRDAGQAPPPFPGPGYGYGDPGRGPHDEPELTGDAKTKAEAAALDAVPGGRVLRSSEEDPAEGTEAKYEVHMADADGKPVEILLDGDFKVVAKRAGGPGGPRGPGMRHRPPPLLTGDTADKARAAALKAVSGGTARAAFAAPPGADARYVVLVTREDDRPVAVLLDGDFGVVRKLDRPPFRGRHGHDGFRGDGPPGPPPGAPS